MEQPQVVLTMPGLTNLDRYELEDHIPADNIRFEQPSATGGKYGELATLVAVVVLSSVAIKALSNWMMKNRRGAILEVTITTNHDGTIKTEKVKLRLDESHAPNPEIIAQMNKGGEVDLASLLKAGGWQAK